jgi:CheY-like chemotaxis protein
MDGRKILIVDDDKEFLEELSDYLQASGYTIIAVDSPDMVLEKAVLEKPDLILFDLKMPGKSGFILANEIRNSSVLSKVPLIAMSGSFRNSDSVFCAAVSTAFAHPPSDIKIIFDPASTTLRAVIMHDVSTPLTHYIKKVDVALNGKEILEQNISRQDNNYDQTVSYLIPDVKEGDVLSVEGYCSISGKLMKKITVNSGK